MDEIELAIRRREVGGAVMIRRYLAPEVAAVSRAKGAGESRVISGYAAVFDSPAHGEVIRAGAFEKTLREHNQKMLLNHNSDYPMANKRAGTLKLWEDEAGLRFEAEITPASWGDDALIAIDRGDIEGMSFGFYLGAGDYAKEETKDGGVIWVIKNVTELFEVSPVTFPWYETTEVGVENALRSLGLDRAGFVDAVARGAVRVEAPHPDPLPEGGEGEEAPPSEFEGGTGEPVGRVDENAGEGACATFSRVAYEQAMRDIELAMV